AGGRLGRRGLGGLARLGLVLRRRRLRAVRADDGLLGVRDGLLEQLLLVGVVVLPDGGLRLGRCRVLLGGDGGGPSARLRLRRGDGRRRRGRRRGVGPHGGDGRRRRRGWRRWRRRLRSGRRRGRGRRRRPDHGPHGRALVGVGAQPHLGEEALVRAP